MTATTTFSAGDPSRTMRGPPFVAPASTPRPATVVVLMKPRRFTPVSFASMRTSSRSARRGIERPQLDRSEPHDVVVILQDDLSFASGREPRRIAVVLALREGRLERRRRQVELQNLLAI